MVSDVRDTICSLKESMPLWDKRIAALRAALNHALLSRQESDFVKDKQISDLLSLVGSLKVSLAYANEKLAVRNKDKYDRTSRSNRYQKDKKGTVL